MIRPYRVFCWHPPLYDSPFVLDGFKLGTNFNAEVDVTFAADAAAGLAQREPGERVLTGQSVAGSLFDQVEDKKTDPNNASVTASVPWWPTGLELVSDRLNGFITELKRLGANLDGFFDDTENGSYWDIPSGGSTAANMRATEADARFSAFAARIGYTSGGLDLWDDNSTNRFKVVKEWDQNKNAHLREAVYNNFKREFPSAIIANYGSSAILPGDEIYSRHSNGNNDYAGPLQYGDMPVMPAYGITESAFRTATPEVDTPMGTMLLCINRVRCMARGFNGEVMPYIGSRSFDDEGNGRLIKIGNTLYYDAAIRHMLMESGGCRGLFFNPSDSTDNATRTANAAFMHEAIEELYELADGGYPDAIKKPPVALNSDSVMSEIVIRGSGKTIRLVTFNEGVTSATYPSGTYTPEASRPFRFEVV